MLQRDAVTLAKLQELVAKLIDQAISESLADVEAALERWRSGSLAALGAHGAVLRHAARCESIVERITAAATDRPESIVKAALVAGFVEESEFVTLVGEASANVETLDLTVRKHESDQDAKRRTVDAMIEKAPVLLHIDTRRDGVVVPQQFAADGALRLRFGYGLTPAISDLTIDDSGVSGTLSFGSVPFRCVLPWPSIYAAQLDGDSQGTVWPDDVPDDVFAAAQSRAKSDAEEMAQPEPAKPSKRGHLRLVD